MGSFYVKAAECIRIRSFYAGINACSRAALTPQNVHWTFLGAAQSLHPATGGEFLYGPRSGQNVPTDNFVQ